MRIPLIVSWDARLNKRGPTVSLQKGPWTLPIVKDAFICWELSKTKHGQSLDDPNNVSILGMEDYWIEFTPECKATNVTIYATKE